MEELGSETKIKLPESLSGESKDSGIVSKNSNIAKSISKSMYQSYCDMKRKMITLGELAVVGGLIMSSNLWINNLSKAWGDLIMPTLFNVFFGILALDVRYRVIQEAKEKK